MDDAEGIAAIVLHWGRNGSCVRRSDEGFCGFAEGGASSQPGNQDLQYACIFPLAAPRDCTEVGAEACDCFPEEVIADRPVCHDTANLEVGTTRYYAKAYSGTRHLQVLRDLGEPAVVASICPKHVVHELTWEEAWTITTRSVAYTNHTLMPEALETWPVSLMKRVLPRHLEIIYEINHRFLSEVRARFPGDDARLRRMSLIREDGERAVRMVHLATVASHHVNGVAGLHSRLLRGSLLSDFAEMYPEGFVNVTNGVTPRRFLGLSNPELVRLIDEAIGTGWLGDLERLRELEPLADDAGFRERFRDVRRRNKESFARFLATRGLRADPSSLFDAQCKRIHEYKRQHLNILHVITLLARLRRGDEADQVPRTFVFSGKAAPSYWLAKLVIRLIHGVAEVVEADARARKLIRVVFVPDFNVKVAQRIYPAADVSEQISTAGTEASGTGNMKFSLNGALTLGTLDGANIDIR